MAVKGGARMLVQAGVAKPSPKIGQALGPLGVNMMEFCKQFNSRTEGMVGDAMMRVELRAMDDRTFEFDVLPPPTSWYLKRVTGIAKGSATPCHATVGDVSAKAIYEIARAKQALDPKMAAMPTKSVAKQIAASAKSFGLRIVKDPPTRA